MNVLLYQHKPNESLKLYLQAFGYKVTDLDYSRLDYFGTIASSTSFDIIILEELPRINSLEHIGWVGPKNNDTPLVLLTSNQSDALAIAAIEAGFTAIWYKPVSYKVFYAQLKQIADPLYIRPGAAQYIDICQGLAYNVPNRSIERDKKIIAQLTDGEDRIFRFLLKRLNKNVLKQDVRKAYGIQDGKSTRTFDTQLCYLKSKLKVIPLLKINGGYKEISMYLDFSNY